MSEYLTHVIFENFEIAFVLLENSKIFKNALGQFMPNRLHKRDYWYKVERRLFVKSELAKL